MFATASILPAMAHFLMGVPSYDSASAGRNGTETGHGLQRSILGNDIFGAGIGLMLLTLSYQFLVSKWREIINILNARSEVEISGDCEAFAFVSSFLAEHAADVRVQSDLLRDVFNWLRPLITSVNQKPKGKIASKTGGARALDLQSVVCKAVYDAVRDENYADCDIKSSNRPSLIFVPNDGSYIVDFKGSRVYIDLATREARSATPNTSNPQQNTSRPNSANSDGLLTDRKIMRVSVDGANDSLARSFIKTCMDEYFDRIGKKTHVFVARDWGWREEWLKVASRNPRELNSIVLKAGILDDIRADMHDFMASEKWYADRGIPYRRGYILYGPPGTGKTSTIFALASHLKLNICIGSLSSGNISDSALQQLLVSSPANSVIVFEDIDVALPKSKRGSSSTSDEGVDDTEQLFDGAAATSKVTLSGLLNALDGIASQEGRIVFLTTNNITALPPALLRPGRCDRRFLFDYADEDVMARLYERFFASCGKKVARCISEKCEALGIKLSAAQLQGFYLRHRSSPNGVLDGVDDFMEELRAQNAEDLEIKRLEKEAREMRKKKKEKTDEDQTEKTKTEE